MRDFGLWK
jgi:hypothetical protein